MLVRWNKAATLPSVFSVFDELFDAPVRTARTFTPRVDVRELEKEFVLRAELPGLSKDDVKLAIENRVLTISGEKKYERKEADHNVHIQETAYGEFSRSFNLGDGIDETKIKADYKDGILTVTLPKSEKAVARQIEISGK
jgi:HSP20 family protein